MPDRDASDIDCYRLSLLGASLAGCLERHKVPEQHDTLHIATLRRRPNCRAMESVNHSDRREPWSIETVVSWDILSFATSKRFCNLEVDKYHNLVWQKDETCDTWDYMDRVPVPVLQQCRVTALLNLCRCHFSPGLERWASSALSMATWLLDGLEVATAVFEMGLEQNSHLDASRLMQHLFPFCPTHWGRCVGNCSQCFHVRHWETLSCRVPRSVVMRETNIGGQNGFGSVRWFFASIAWNQEKDTITNTEYIVWKHMETHGNTYVFTVVDL